MVWSNWMFLVRYTNGIFAVRAEMHKITYPQWNVVGIQYFVAVNPGALVKINGIMDSTKYQAILVDNLVGSIIRDSTQRWFCDKIYFSLAISGAWPQSNCKHMGWTEGTCNTRVWRILQGSALRTGPKSLQVCSLTLSSITGKTQCWYPSEVDTPINQWCQFFFIFVGSIETLKYSFTCSAFWISPKSLFSKVFFVHCNSGVFR